MTPLFGLLWLLAVSMSLLFSALGTSVYAKNGKFGMALFSAIVYMVGIIYLKLPVGGKIMATYIEIFYRNSPFGRTIMTVFVGSLDISIIIWAFVITIFFVRWFLNGRPKNPRPANNP